MSHEIPPNFLFYMALSLVTGSGLWFLLLMIAFGDAKRIPWAFMGKCALVCLMLVGLSQAQAPAQAQQESTRRIERLEDQTRVLDRDTVDIKRLTAVQADLLKEIATANGKQDERLQQLEKGLEVITASAESVKATTESFKGSVQLWLSIAGAIFIAVQVGIAWKQDKSLRNGHSPWAKIEKQLETQGQQNQKLMQDLMTALVDRDRVDPPPRRRTR